jgi:hypothetical protein
VAVEVAILIPSAFATAFPAEILSVAVVVAVGIVLSGDVVDVANEFAVFPVVVAAAVDVATPPGSTIDIASDVAVASPGVGVAVAYAVAVATDGIVPTANVRYAYANGWYGPSRRSVVSVDIVTGALPSSVTVSVLVVTVVVLAPPDTVILCVRVFVVDMVVIVPSESTVVAVAVTVTFATAAMPPNVGAEEGAGVGPKVGARVGLEVAGVGAEVGAFVGIFEGSQLPIGPYVRIAWRGFAIQAALAMSSSSWVVG